MTRSQRFLGLNAARILASFHIVIGHLYQKSGVLGGEMRCVYLFAWGYTWVPWFFMMSGFVLTHARLKSKQPSRRESVVLFIKKRTAVIYPVYALSVLLAYLIDWWRDKALPPWYVGLSQGLLAQSWLPWLPEKSVQLHCWFLSAMVPYWALFDIVLHGLVLRVTRLTTCCLALLLFSLPPWAAYIFPSQVGGRSDWYSTHRTGVLEDEVDYIVVTLKFSPICYFHVFVFGMLLARTRYLVSVEIAKASSQAGIQLEAGSSLEQIVDATRRQRGSIFQNARRRLSGIRQSFVGSGKLAHPSHGGTSTLQSAAATGLAFLFRYGATTSYIGLLCVFTIEELKPPSWKISARLSVLILLQGLLLVGLCPIEEARRWHDPVEWLLSHAPPAWGNVSYAQYILQFLAYAVWPREFLTSWWELGLFFLFLLASSYLTVETIIAPFGTLWHRAKPRTTLAVACGFSAVFASCCAIDKELRSASKGGGGAALLDGCGNPLDTSPAAAAALPPPYVRMAEEAIDVRLNWTAAEGDFAEHRTLINPSLLWHGGRMLRAARAHAVTCARNSSVVWSAEQSERWDMADTPEHAWQVGDPTIVYTTTWHSDVAYDSNSSGGSAAAWAGWDVAAWGLDGAGPLRKVALGREGGPGGDAQWGGLCEVKPRWLEVNRTLWRTVVTGPEDPKLGLFPSTFASTGESDAAGVVRLVFDSMPPKSAAAAVNAGVAATVDPSGQEPEAAEIVEDGCAARPKYQMFQTTTPLEAVEGGGYRAQGAKSTCGEDTQHEKNWISFADGDALRYVHAVSDHVVKTQDAQGQCLPGAVYTAPGRGSPMAVALAELKGTSADDVGLHGSGSAVDWDGGSRLALFHTKDAHDAYVTYAYTMQASSPYGVIAVSRPLPLAGANGAFASSLAIPPGGDKVVVAYGVADAESRALVMSKARTYHARTMD